MIDCKENEDGSLTISWDENDPSESVLNTWTEEDFIRAIKDYIEAIDNVKQTNTINEQKEN